MSHSSKFLLVWLFALAACRAPTNTRAPVYSGPQRAAVVNTVLRNVRVSHVLPSPQAANWSMSKHASVPQSEISGCTASAVVSLLNPPVANVPGPAPLVMDPNDALTIAKPFLILARRELVGDTTSPTNVGIEVDLDNSVIPSTLVIFTRSARGWYASSMPTGRAGSGRMYGDSYFVSDTSTLELRFYLLRDRGSCADAPISK